MVKGRGKDEDSKVGDHKESPKRTCVLDGRLLASTTRGSYGWSMENPVMANLNRRTNIRCTTVICQAMSVALLIASQIYVALTLHSRLFKFSRHDDLTGREQKHVAPEACVALHNMPLPALVSETVNLCR